MFPFDPQQQRRRLLTRLALILAVAFAAASILAYGVSSREVRRGIVDRELPLTGESIYSEIQRDILRPVFVSAQMAQNTWLRDWVESGEKDEQPLRRYLREVQVNNDAVTSFYVSVRTRRYYHASGRDKTVSESDPADAWFFRVLKMAEPYETNADPDAMNKERLTFFINYKMFGTDGKLLGVTGVGLSSENLVKLIRDYERRFSRRILLVDELGNVALTSETDATLPGRARELRKLSQLHGLREIESRILNRDPSQTRLSYVNGQGETTFVNSRYVPDLRWYVVVEQDESKALAPVRRVLVATALIGLAALLLTVAIVQNVVGRFQRQLEAMATTDELSQLPNRRTGERTLERAVHGVDGQAQPLGLLVLNVDHFKVVNDTHGHATGDRVIAAIARNVQEAVRPGDFVSRWGGEEFLILLRDSDATTTHDVAQRVRQAVERGVIDAGGVSIGVTVSVGVAQWLPGESAAAFFARADAALLRAKREGRNRVVVAATEPASPAAPPATARG